jgi:DNA-binding NtrC family response regulator
VSEETADRLELAVFSGGVVTVLPLPASGSVTIGREEGNDIRIDHPSVSRRHALLHLDPPIRIEDLGGANGTFVRDPEGAGPGNTEGVRRIRGESVVLEVGDTVTLGTAVVGVRQAGAEGGAIERLRREVAAEDRERIVRALEACGGNQTKAAALLGISRRTLVSRLGEHALPRPRKKPPDGSS